MRIGAGRTTRLIATCDIADLPAIMEVPAILPSSSRTLMPSRASLDRINATLRAPAVATATKGMKERIRGILRFCVA